MIPLLLFLSLMSIQAIPSGWESGFLRDTLQEFNQAYPEAGEPHNRHNSYQDYSTHDVPNRVASPALDRQDSFDFSGLNEQFKNVFGHAPQDEPVLPQHLVDFNGDGIDSYYNDKSSAGSLDPTFSVLHQNQPSKSNFFEGISGIIGQYKHDTDNNDDGEEEVSSMLHSSAPVAPNFYEPLGFPDMHDSFDYSHSIDTQQEANEPIKFQFKKSEKKKGMAALQEYSNIKGSHKQLELYSYGLPDPQWDIKYGKISAKIKAKIVYERYAQRETRRTQKFEARCNLKAAKDLLSGNEMEQQRAAFWIQWGFSTSLRLPRLRKSFHKNEKTIWTVFNQVHDMVGGDKEETLCVLEKMMTPEIAANLKSADETVKANQMEKIRQHFVMNSAGVEFTRE